MTVISLDNDRPLKDGNSDKQIVISDWDSGFFSNSSVALYRIIGFFNHYKRLPHGVDFSQSYKWYKDNPDQDVYRELFRQDIDIDIQYKDQIGAHHGRCHSDFSKIEYDSLNPFIRKYFTPRKHVVDFAYNYLSEHSILPEKTVGIIYRGTDLENRAQKSTGEDPRKHFLDMMLKVFDRYPNYRFIIETEQQQMREEAENLIPGCHALTILPSTGGNILPNRPTWKGGSADPNLDAGMRSLASVYLISLCKKLVLFTSNMGLWACQFRGHCNGMYQYWCNMKLGINDQWTFHSQPHEKYKWVICDD